MNTFEKITLCLMVFFLKECGWARADGDVGVLLCLSGIYSGILFIVAKADLHKGAPEGKEEHDG